MSDKIDKRDDVITPVDVSQIIEKASYILTNIYNMNENYVCKVYTEVIVPKGTYCTDANSTASIDNNQYADVKVAVPLWINL